MTPPISTSYQNVTPPKINCEENSKENYRATSFCLDGSLGISGILSSPLCTTVKDNIDHRCTSNSETPKDKSNSSLLNMTILFPELNCTTQSNNIENERKEVGTTNCSSQTQESFQHNNVQNKDAENDINETEETSEQRMAREQEESIELARQLMAEEAMASYSLSVDYLRNNADAFSAEDLQAFNVALQSEEEQAAVEEFEEESNEDLSYDAMLRLGERIGDVKTDRWKLVAKKEIAKLPTITYVEKLLVGDNKDDDSLQRCLVCQCCYEKGDCMRKLPCGHYFHKDCVDQWLHSKDFCPYCRQSIV